MRKAITACVCLLFLASMLGASAVVFAKKPDQPPGKPEEPKPAGTIYFGYYDGTGNAVWTMNADGSEKTKTIPIDCKVSELSRSKHGDYYWYIGFCTIDGEYYPSGLPRREVFAVRDDDTSAVQLTDDPLLAINHRMSYPIWGVDDTTVTIEAIRWVCDPTCEIDETQVGYFNATVNYDENGDITGADPPVLIWWTELKQDSEGNWRPTTGYEPDWSPDGTKIVRRRGKSDINVVDLVAGTETVLTSGAQPHWSPDGSKIAFCGPNHEDLRTINPDGTDEQIIAETRDLRIGQWQTINRPRWSPDSKYLLYKLSQFVGGDPSKNKYWIYRIDVDGSGKKCLTNDLPAGAPKDPVGWR